MAYTAEIPNEAAAAPIGVFDSGIGGLSVLRALRNALPAEAYVYLADSGHAPYGERGAPHIHARSLAAARLLVEAQGAKALVVACNSATTTAIAALRQHYPQLPIIGVEPAVKPAVAATRTGRVGVLATRATVQSARFAALCALHGGGVEIVAQACDGLARAIERSLEPAADATELIALCAEYTRACGPFGSQVGQTDVLVLGCTHYVFAEAELRSLVGKEVQLLDTGAPVARQVRRLLAQRGSLRAGDSAPANAVRLFTTGDAVPLARAAARWLGLPGPVATAIDAP